MSDGLFLRCCRETADKFPEIKFEEKYLDTGKIMFKAFGFHDMITYHKFLV